MSDMEDQPLLAHLLELRKRLMRVLWVFTAGFILFSFFSSQLYDFMVAPLVAVLPEGRLISIGIASPFFLQMKMVAWAALLLTLPHTLYQIWGFVAPGLYQHEKKLVIPLVLSSTLLFFAGISFAYYFVFGVVFRFMFKVIPDAMQWLPDSDEYFAFAMNLFVAFGVAFETPVVVVLLVRMGIVSLEKLIEVRSYMIVAAFIVAAVLAPPDVVSQLLLAIPLCILYELGLLAARWTPPASSESES